MNVQLLSKLHALGINECHLRACKLLEYEECKNLVRSENDMFGRVQRMSPTALSCWHKLKRAAAKDSIELLLVSAFRSIDYQCELITRKLKKGEDLSTILKVNAIPGFSEHHTGQALDLNTTECCPLSEEFELTSAFDWLQENASHYKFSMSFPRNNIRGMVYEPWHWTCQIRP
ncbi:MAG: M15 family metallopeptidase [Candidatus Azotimanducaceae bacterium]|uniref:D-alanyl-D-alanine carboxypeptidase family protein n=1 Tax=OM182 bacterium TaxID=2510334 RepID=A0A520S3S2_9GAMM|nr:hypothetical protein [Gammaproteobacteria bacterium]OUV67620.1 MAG: hypothetical protein CBC93_04965 [Gammaproteobacteria bacterium TMED133]RZO77086.1 MAG: D-alanyl-D-alanine carboxypeptidase family protein [OM182 bacterium]